MITRQFSVIIIAIVASSCLRCQPEYYVPTQDEVRERFASFIVTDAFNLQPRYKNPDVDSMIATYCVPRPLPIVFADIEHQVEGGWKIKEKSATRLSFWNYTAVAAVRRYEIVEVRASGSRCVTLAWLEADGVTPETYEGSSVRRWSQREFWPHVDRIS